MTNRGGNQLTPCFQVIFGSGWVGAGIGFRIMLIYYQNKRKKHPSISPINPLSDTFCPASLTLYPSSL